MSLLRDIVRIYNCISSNKTSSAFIGNTHIMYSQFLLVCVLLHAMYGLGVDCVNNDIGMDMED